MSTNASLFPTLATPRRTRRTGILGMVALAWSIWRERRQLSRLDAARLADIGRTPAEARREAQRPIWDAPNRWLR